MGLYVSNVETSSWNYFSSNDHNSSWNYDRVRFPSVIIASKIFFNKKIVATFQNLSLESYIISCLITFSFCLGRRLALILMALISATAFLGAACSPDLSVMYLSLFFAGFAKGAFFLYTYFTKLSVASIEQLLVSSSFLQPLWGLFLVSC